MMLRALRFLGLTALFTVTASAALLLFISVGMVIGELSYWGLRQLGKRLIWSWLILAHVPIRVFAPELAWIAAAGALYLVGREPVSSGAGWRTVRASVGLTLGFYALVRMEIILLPALARTASPFDRPLLSAPVFVYCLVAPWVFGRLERRGQMKSASP